MRGADASRPPRPRAAARRSAAYAAFGAWLAIAAAACADRPKDPLQLDGNRLTVDNRTSTDWSNVEIWLNTYYRVTVPSIPSMARFVAPLDTFVAAYGQRFDFHRAQVRDLRLVAKLPDGKPIELKKKFEEGGLAPILGGVGGKR